MQAEKGFRPPISEILESLTHMIEEYRRMRTPSDAADLDPYEKSFRSTHSRFVGSPTVSYLSI